MVWKPKTCEDYIPRDTPDEVAIPLLLARAKKRSTVTDDGCWIWNGTTNEKGYGQISFRGKQRMLHKLSYQIHRGEVPAGHLVCHKCDKPRCWNPEHLWTGTPKQNSLDMSNKRRQRWQRHTHCQRGHEFTEENTWVFYRNGRPIRKCRACSRGVQRIRMGWSPEEAYTVPAIAPDEATARRHFGKRASG